MGTHYVDAYGDLAPTELYVTDDGSRVDTYGDPEPYELWVEECNYDDAGNCYKCGEPR